MILILTVTETADGLRDGVPPRLQAANRKLESKLQSFLFMQPSHGLSYRQSLSLSWGYTRPRMIANLCLGISVEVLSLFVPKDSPWTTIVSTTLFVLVLLLICPLLVRSALELRNFSRANIPINSAVRRMSVTYWRGVLFALLSDLLCVAALVIVYWTLALFTKAPGASVCFVALVLQIFVIMPIATRYFVSWTQSGVHILPLPSLPSRQHLPSNY